MPTLLVVEDLADIRQLLAVLLKMESYQVVEAEHGQMALEYLQSGGACDLVISDLMMPQVRGDELARQLLADPRFATLPVIILSGTDPALLPPNVVAQIMKPLDVAELLHVVRQHASTPASSAS